MLAQAVAYLLGKRDLVKGFHWSEGANPRWGLLTSTPSRNSSSEVGGADEPEITVSCRWIHRWRGKMFRKFERNAVLKIKVFHRKIPDVTHSLGLFYAEVWSGEDMEIHVLKNSMEPVWEQGMLSGNQPGHCRNTTGDFWGVRRSQHTQICVVYLPIRGMVKVAVLGMGLLARQPVTPYIQYQPCPCLHHPQSSDLTHSGASSQVSTENFWVVTKPDQPCRCLFCNTVPRRQKGWGLSVFTWQS